MEGSWGRGVNKYWNFPGSKSKGGVIGLGDSSDAAGRVAILEGREAAGPERRQAQGTVIQRIDVVGVVAVEVEP